MNGCHSSKLKRLSIMYLSLFLLKEKVLPKNRDVPQKVMRRFVVVFKGAYEIASLSSRTTCLPAGRPESLRVPNDLGIRPTHWNSPLNSQIFLHSCFCFFLSHLLRRLLVSCLSLFLLKEKVTKKFKDNPIRSARLSGQRHRPL